MSAFILHTNDKDRGQVLGNCLSFITQLPDTKAWRVEVKPWSPPRTSDANAYLWGVCYKLIVTELGYLSDDWHEFYCMEFFGKRATPSGAKPIRTTTTDEYGKKDVMEGAAFWKFVEHVRRMAGAGGVYIPDPDPAMKKATNFPTDRWQQWQ